MVDSEYLSRCHATNQSVLTDQYTDGIAAKLWDDFIGDRHLRVKNYKDVLSGILRKHGCKRVLDLGTGTGVDSITLCEEGFEVTSIDASDKMLKEALKVRWERRKEEAFDKWVIMEANWLTLDKDIPKNIVGQGFDAVVNLGNSFSHVPDFDGDRRYQRQALQNFWKVLKPGGLLIMDQRNYDYILDNGGAAPKKCIYFNSQCESDIRTSLLYVDGEPKLITLDYYVKPLNSESSDKTKNEISTQNGTNDIRNSVQPFPLACYPHRFKDYCKLLDDTFSNAKHTILQDWKPLEQLDKNDPPGFYVHILEKPKH